MNPPPVANADANALLDDAYGAVHPTQDDRIAGSIKRRKLAKTLLDNQRITNAELGQQEVFHLQNTLQGLPQVPGIPPALGAVLHNLDNTVQNLAIIVNNNHQNLTSIVNTNHQNLTNDVQNLTNNVQNLTNDVQNVTNDVQNLRNDVQNLTARMDGFDLQMQNLAARQHNSTASDPEDALLPIRNQAGNVALNFPLTMRDLNNLDPQELSDLLHFYGKPRHPAATRFKRCKQLLGIPH
jgi:uncharacterized protein YoxC